MPRKLTNRLRIVKTENLEARTLLSASMVSCVAEAAVDSEMDDTSEPESSDDSSLNQEQSTAADNTESSDLLEDELNCEISDEQDTSDSDTSDSDTSDSDTSDSENSDSENSDSENSDSENSDSENSDSEDSDAAGSTGDGIEEDSTENAGTEDNAEQGDDATVREAAAEEEEEEEEGDLAESCEEASAEDLDAYSQSTTELAESGSEPADEVSVIEDGEEASLLADSNEPVELCPDDTTDVEENSGEPLATNDETPSTVDESATDTALTTPTDSCAPEEMLAGDVLADESTEDIAQATDDLPDTSEEIAGDVQNCLENGNSDQLASQAAIAEPESDETVGLTSSDEQTDESQIATLEEETVSEETMSDAPSPSAFAWPSEDGTGTVEDTEDEGDSFANAAESEAGQFVSVESDSEFASSEESDSADATSMASTASTESQDLTAMANCEAEEPNDEPDADDSTAELLAAGDLDAACECPDQIASEDTELAETSLPSDVDADSQTLLASSIGELEDGDAIGQPDVELGTLSGPAAAFASDASIQRASSSESEIA